MFQIKSFKTEYQLNPMGIICEKPRFSWYYEAGSYIVQKAYRILVASSLERLSVEKADLWDSGIVVSEQMTGIEYQGEKLFSRKVCYVLCEAENIQGEKSKIDAQTFEMGLMAETDWKGRWVSIPVNFNGGTLYFRKIIKLTEGKKILRARAYICGIGYHELYLNGQKIGKNVLSPGVTEYSKRVFYCVYDITDVLKEKDNVVGVEIGYGWFGARKMLAQFYFDYEDGSTSEEHSNCCCGWWVSGSPVVDNSIYGGEVYDARIEDHCPQGWSNFEFEPTWANGWMYTILTQPPEGKLEPELLEPIAINAFYPEVSRTKLSDNVWVFDMGQNIAGWVRIRVHGTRDSRITLKFAEGLCDDGSVNQLNLRSARCSDTYILKGQEVEEYAPRFTYHGFQYVQAEIEGNVEIYSLVGEHVHTAVEKIGEFECSNTILNQLHQNAVITEQNNLHSIMTDCPQRDERFGWLNDLSSRIYQTVYNFRMDRFFPKFLRDISHTQNEYGAIADTVPYYTGGQPADVVCVSYLLFGIECYKQYGDCRVVQEEYPHFKAWVDFLLMHQKNYIMDYFYYADWVAPAVFIDSNTDGIFISSVFLYWHLSIMAQLAKINKNEVDFAKYSLMATESKKSINLVYYHAETQNYSTGTQGENSLALSLRIAPQADRKKIAENIVADMKRRNNHCTCGNQTYRHMFYALTEEGYIDELVNMITNPEYPGWGFMIACGATTVWERWEQKMQNEMHSFDHPMFGSYDAWFYHDLGGIQIEDDAKACDKITIAPKIPDSLDYVHCSHFTIRGKVGCNWKKVVGGIDYEIEIPANTTATIILGGTILFAIDMESQKKLYGDHCLKVQSGRYRIQTKL